MTNTALMQPSRFLAAKFSANWAYHQLFDLLIGAISRKHIQPNTKVVFLESRFYYHMEVHDIPTIVSAVRRIAPENRHHD